MQGKELRVFEAFAGIGAQRKALDIANIKYKIVGMAEWYVDALFSYQVIHNNFSKNKSYDNENHSVMTHYLSGKPLSIDSKKLVDKKYWQKKSTKFLRNIYKAVKMSEKEGNIFDVSLLHKRGLKNIDLLTYSFPCQDLSQQGKQKGMAKNSSSRSSLIWQIERALDNTKKKDLPKFLLLENVKAICNKRNINVLKKWKAKLKSLGYVNDFKVLNASKFGGCQARQRAFMLSTLNHKTALPEGNKKPRPIKDILDKVAQSKDILHGLSKYQLTNAKLTRFNIKKRKLIGYTKFNSENYVYDPFYTGPTLTASGANSRIKILDNNKIRKISAREAYKYMGFSVADFNKVNNYNFLSENKIIYTAGNSIPIKMLVAIMLKIKKQLKNFF